MNRKKKEKKRNNENTTRERERERKREKKKEREREREKERERERALFPLKEDTKENGTVVYKCKVVLNGGEREWRKERRIW